MDSVASQISGTQAPAMQYDEAGQSAGAAHCTHAEVLVSQSSPWAAHCSADVQAVRQTL